MIVADIGAAALVSAAPLIWAALGETYSQRAGVANVELEGIMLMGAFSGVIGSHYTGSIVVGLLMAIAGGLLVAALHGLISLTLRGNQIVSGIGLNLLMLGLTGFLLNVYFRGYSLTAETRLSKTSIPLLSDIPMIGQIFFQQNIGVYLLYVLVPLSVLVLYRSPWGIRIIACGENPYAADSQGVSVSRVRWQALLFAGAMGGIGGGLLAFVQLRAFVDNMIQGRGFIALAAVLFANWRPGYVAAGLVLFGVVDALQFHFQAIGVGIPSQLLTMFPYVAAILALSGLIGRSRAPAYFTIPYIRGIRGGPSI